MSNVKRKVILTCAVTGNAPFNPKHPCFPVTPAQIAESSIEAAKAGASIVHLHVRNPETGAGSRDLTLFRELVGRVRNHQTDIVINLSAGGGAVFLPDPVGCELQFPTYLSQILAQAESGKSKNLSQFCHSENVIKKHLM